MNKCFLALFILLAVFKAESVWAVTGISACTSGCPGIKQVCCGDINSAYGNCCASSQAACATSCKPPEVTDNCPTECPSTLTWKATTNNREARCKSATLGGCYYRCKEGYYNRGATLGQPTDSLTCAVCPDNATCAAGSGLVSGETLPKCDKGYYGSKSTILYPATYSCSRCPAIQGASGIFTFGTTSSSGATSVTQCYVKSGSYRVERGMFTVTGNCNYSN